MQMFFLKNIVGVSIAVLIFTAITIGTIADQAPALMSEENNPNVMPSKTEQGILGDSFNGNPTSTPLPETTEVAPGGLNNDNGLLQTLDPLEKTPDEFNPLESPEQRLVEEWENLGIIPENKEEAQPSQADDTPAVPQADDTPAVPQADDTPAVPQVDDTPAVPQVDELPAAPQVDELPAAPQVDEAPAIPQVDEAPAIPQVDEAPAIPQTGELDIQMNNQSADDPEVPVRFGAKAVIIRPSFIRAALKFDNEEGLPKPKPVDPMDPTLEGTGPEGKHKGGPKVLELKSIPIIKMGENFQGYRGVKVIKPGNS